MTDPTVDFFGQLADRGHEPLLRNAAGSIRFDLARDKRTDRWLLTVQKGDVTVSRQNVKADAVVRMDKSLFDRFARGEANAMAALLRGELLVDGDLEIVIAFQRVLPGPAGPTAGDGARRQS